MRRLYGKFLATTILALALLCLTLQAFAQGATTELEMAADAVKAGKYRHAIMYYSQALEHGADPIKTRLDLARVYKIMQKWTFVEKEAEKILAQDPQSAEGLVLMGDVFAFKKEWQAAREQYQTALERDPDNFNANRQMSHVLLKLGDRDGAAVVQARFQELLNEKMEEIRKDN